MRGVLIDGKLVEFDDDGGYQPRAERRTSEEMKPKVEKRMARIDSLTREQRMVVHEYGWNLVQSLMDNGVTSPTRMRSVINAVMANAVDRMYRDT